MIIVFGSDIFASGHSKLTSFSYIPGTEKPVFEVNQKSCEREKLKISSKVLRLARHVIGDKSADSSFAGSSEK